MKREGELRRYQFYCAMESVSIYKSYLYCYNYFSNLREACSQMQYYHLLQKILKKFPAHMEHDAIMDPLLLIQLLWLYMIKHKLKVFILQVMM